jgi:hypothetical protein
MRQRKHVQSQKPLVNKQGSSPKNFEIPSKTRCQVLDFVEVRVVGIDSNILHHQLIRRGETNRSHNVILSAAKDLTRWGPRS